MSQLSHLFARAAAEPAQTASPSSREAPARSALARLVLALFFLMACGATNQVVGTQPGTAPLPSISVDSSLTPYVTTLPGVNNEGPRTVAAMTDASGVQADFVDNELLVSTSDNAALQALIARWNGTLLATTIMKSAGLNNVLDQALVRIDGSRARAAQLAGDLHSIAPKIGGKLRVSSQLGLLTLAAAAHESATEHLLVIPNFLVQSDNEAPSGDALGSIPYNPDPSTWPYMDNHSPQDIGVAAAWNALTVAGHPITPVRLAILDAGFSQTSELPAGTVMIPASANNVPNPWHTDTGGSDAWHGTQTADTAVGVVGNGFGGAGTAGATAQAILVQSPGQDLFQIINYFARVLPALASMRPQILNMSFSVRVPAPFNGGVQLLTDPITRAIHDSGIIIVAAAGNNGQDVDARDCFGVCWNRAFWAPCQNADVVCVGGLNINLTTRNSQSNFSSSSAIGGEVSMYAPFDVWTGPDPSTSPSGDTTNRAVMHSGTSFSSPFVAGVASLVWAANPTLSADQVQQLLFSTAHTGSPDATVPRWINALAAVSAALAGNHTPVPPQVHIVAPADGSHFTAGSTVSLAATSHQFGGHSYTIPDAHLVWTQVRDGGSTESLPSGATITHQYDTPGTYVVTLTGTADNGLTGQAEITIVIDPAPPTYPASVTIVAPTATDFYIPSGQSSVPVTFSATGSPGMTFSWSDSVQGPLGTGPSISANLTDTSDSSTCDTVHVVTVTGTDTLGRVVTATITVHVHACIP